MGKTKEMEGKVLKTISQGKALPITITVTDDGYFKAYRDGEEINSSREYIKLEDALMKGEKRERIRISVPFTDGKTGDDGEITGKHGRTGNWLVNVGTAKGEQVYTYNLGNDYEQRLNRLDTAQKAELLRRIQAIKDAEEAYEAFCKTHRFTRIAAVAEKAWKDAGGE